MNKKQIIEKIVNDLPMRDMLGKMTKEEWYGWFEECWDKAINSDDKDNALHIDDVNGSSFELFFGNHLKAKMIIKEGKLEVVAAVDGWGDAVPLDQIYFVV